MKHIAEHHREWFNHGVVVLQVPLDPFANCYQHYFAELSAEEQARANRYQKQERRQAFVIGRTLMRDVLSWFYETLPERIVIGTDVAGKPRREVKPKDQPVLNFNVSHSGNVAVIGLTTLSEIGVDVETHDSRIDSDLLMRNYFNATEHAAWMRLDPRDRRSTFLRAWTRKEAAWKMNGNESVRRWNDIEVSFDGSCITRIRVRNDVATSEQLLCYSWNFADSEASAVIQTPARIAPPFYVIPVEPTFAGLECTSRRDATTDVSGLALATGESRQHQNQNTGG